MSEETYVISGDGTGTEIEVQDVICTKCGHYEYKIPDEAAKVDDSFICNLCSTPDGVIRGVRKFEQCSVCSEVYDVKNPICFCPNEPKPLMTYYHKSNELKNPMVKRRDEEIEQGKLHTFEKNIVRTARQKDYDRQVRTDENLDKLVKLLVKKENKHAI